MKNRKNVLEIGNQSEILYLNPNNILCIEASGNYCNIYLVDGEELESVGFQKGEVARMIDEQLPHNLASKFIQVGRSYIINIEYIQRINVPREQLTFDVFNPSNGKKRWIRIPALPLRKLREAMETTDAELVSPVPKDSRATAGGFAEFIAAPKHRRILEEKNYEIGEDEVIFLG